MSYHNHHLIGVVIFNCKVGEVVGAAGTEGSSRSANKKMFNGKVWLDLVSSQN